MSLLSKIVKKFVPNLFISFFLSLFCCDLYGWESVWHSDNTASGGVKKKVIIIIEGFRGQWAEHGFIAFYNRAHKQP